MSQRELETGASVLDMTILGQVAIGGSATVYRARRDDDAIVALKVLHKQRSRDPIEVARMRAEFELGQTLCDIEGVLAPLEHGTIPALNDRPYLVFPFVSGEALDYKVIHGALPPNTAASILRRITAVLRQIHERGVVHSDIKPSNIMLTAKGEIMILDFGHALRLEQAPPAGSVVGSRLYMAPEQATGGVPSFAWDVYGLGMTLFEMVVGRAPYSNLPANEALQKRCMPNARPIRVLDYRPRIPEGIAAIADALLQQDPACRPPLDRLRAALDSYLLGESFSTHDKTLTQTFRPAKRPQSGAKTQRYEIGRELGEGGCATVYRARDTVHGRHVALKVLIDRYKGRPERERLIRDEAQALEAIGEHPNIVRLLDEGHFAEFDDWPYLALEEIDGVLLEDLTIYAPEPLPTRRVADLAMQVALAVRHCHRHGVIHRDLTLSNVIVEDEGRGRAVLIDFGHRGWIDGPRVPAGHPDRRTLSLDVPGTVHAMSPEQARAEPATTAMDVYAFGALLYRMLTSQAPFPHHGDRNIFIAMQAAEKLIAPLIDCESRRDIPPALAELTHSCLEVRPEDRPSMNEVVEQLEVALATLGMPVPPMTAVLSVPEVLVALQAAPASKPPAQAAIKSSSAVAEVVVEPNAVAVAVESNEDAAAGAIVVAESNPRPTDWGRIIGLVVLLAGTVVLLVSLAMWSPWDEQIQPSDREPTGIAGSGMMGADTKVEPPARPIPQPEPGAESGAEPQPDAGSSIVPEPKPKPKAKPKPRRSKARPRKKKPKPSPEPPAAVDCKAVEAAANKKVAQRAWNAVLRVTEPKDCRSSAVVRLRLNALYELRRFDKCVAEGRASGLAAKRLVARCESQLGTP